MSRTASSRRVSPMLLVLILAVFAGDAVAAGSGMPWEGPLEQIVDSITGPVARAAGVIAVVLVGITIAFSEGGSGVRKLAYVGLGLCLAFWAASGALELFGFAGGAVL